jgi:signal peptidase I
MTSMLDKPTSAKRVAAGAAAAIALLGAWLLLAPPSLGGQFRYAVVSGTSMEPLLRHGDLVLLRPHATYRVGEVVAYKNAQLRRVVLHRIIRRSGPYYIFKGDNNNFVDPDRPTRGDLVGSLWLTVPMVGTVVGWLRTPAIAALTTSALVLLFFGWSAAAHRRRRVATPSRESRPTGAGQSASGGGVPAARHVVLVGAALTVVSLLAAVVAYSHATTTSTSSVGAYTQQGVYSATAAVAPSTLYPSGRVVTGETMFVSAVKHATLGFRYRLLSSLPHDVHGRAQLHLSLTSALGWSTDLPTPPARSFAGDKVDLTTPIDLTALERSIRSYLRLSGEPADTFTVSLAPQISVRGTISGTSLVDSFSPAPISFIVDDRSFRLQDQTLGSAAPGQPPTSSLTPSSPGVISRHEPATMRMLVLSERVKTVRRVSLLGLLAGIMLALGAAAILKTRRPGPEPTDGLTDIRRRYRDRLVQITSPPLEPRGGYTDVSEMDDLARLAHSLDRPILEHSGNEQHTFYIEDRSTYRHRLAPEASRQATSPAPAPSGLRAPVLADSGSAQGNGTVLS